MCTERVLLRIAVVFFSRVSTSASRCMVMEYGWYGRRTWRWKKTGSCLFVSCYDIPGNKDMANHAAATSFLLSPFLVEKKIMKRIQIQKAHHRILYPSGRISEGVIALGGYEKSTCVDFYFGGPGNQTRGLGTSKLAWPVVRCPPMPLS